MTTKTTHTLQIQAFKLLRLLPLLSVLFTLNVQAQHSDHVMQPIPIERPYSITELEDSTAGNQANIKITDIQTSSSTFDDLYYTVFVKLYYRTNDLSLPALLLPLDVQCTLKVYGTDFPGNTSDSLVKYDSLQISPYQDYAAQAYYFNKDNEVVSGLNLYDLDSAKLQLDLTQFNHLDSLVLANIYVELSVEIGRYFRDNVGSIDPELVTYDASDTSNSLKQNEAIVYWTHADQPASYELELLHIPSSDPSSVTNIDPDFSKNAIRVQTDKNYFPLNLFYTDGFLVVRGRVKRPIPNENKSALLDQYTYSTWSLPLDTTAYAVTSDNVLKIEHGTSSALKTMNWQLNTSHANESKRVDQINYFDGSNRSRQENVLTVNEDDETSIPASAEALPYQTRIISRESYYDHGGQKLIDVLPSPVSQSNDIAYQLGLNLMEGAKLVKEDYDSVYKTVNIIMDDTSKGAANYYSDSNGLIGTDSIINYLPDAKGYPYSRTEYLKDGSGRLKTLYGVGEEKAQNDTTATRYAYAKPTTSNLERLFGSNVGLANFYKKNISIDPNGIMQISYLDHKDRVVASAIDGIANSASNMYNIPFDTITLSDDLMRTGAEQYNSSNEAYELTYPIFVGSSSTYQFEYGFDINAYEECGGSICFDCRYELQFQILDENNTLVIDILDSIVEVDSNTCSDIYRIDTISYKANAQDTVLGNVVSVSLQAQRQYTIIKKLRFLKDRFELIADTYIDSLNCGLYDLNHFIELELDSAHFEKCQLDYAYENDDPCKEIEKGLRDDFIYPGGTFVQGATDGDTIPDFIYEKLMRVSGCHELDTITKIQFRYAFTGYYSLLEVPTFADFEYDFTDFLIHYHPTYCQLPLCREYNSEENLKYVKVLEMSNNLEQFERYLKKYQLMHDSIQLINHNTIIFKRNNDALIKDSISFIHFDTLLKKLIHDTLYTSFLDSFFYKSSDDGSSVYGIDSNFCYIKDYSEHHKNSLDSVYILSYFDGLAKGSSGNDTLKMYELADLITKVNDSALLWRNYRDLYLRARRAIIEDILATVVCFKPLYRDSVENYDTMLIIDNSLLKCIIDTAADYRFPPWNESSPGSGNYPNYAHFTHYRFEFDSLALAAAGADVDLANPNEQLPSFDTSAFYAKQLFAYLKTDSCVHPSDSAVFVDTLNAELLMCNPFQYLDTLLDSSLINCNIYEKNLASVLADLRNLTDSSGEAFYACIDTVLANPRYTCASFLTAHGDYITAMAASYPVPRVTDITQIDTDSSAQIIYRNWMNMKLGLNLSFWDYFEFASVCVLENDTNVFGDTVIWSDTGKVPAIRTAVIKYPDTNFFDLNSAQIYSLVDDSIASPYTVSATDLFGFGEVALDNNQYDLYYLEDGVSDFTTFLDTLNDLYNFLRLRDSTRFDIEDSLPTIFARRLPLLQYDSINETKDNNGFNLNDGISTNYLIDRAYQYANGTLWVRLLNASDSTYNNDVYFHYVPFNKAYFLSDLDSIDISRSAGNNTFDSISPVFDQEEMHYVKLWNYDLNAEMLVRSARPFGQAHKVNRMVLGPLQGRSFYPYPSSCEDLKYETALINAQVRYDAYLKAKRDTFIENYRNFCLNLADDKAFENQYLNMSYASTERQFTLYYYDQADNLVMTVPPAGVDLNFDYDSLTSVEIDNYRKNPLVDDIIPDHTKVTTYKYNADNQIIRSITPNGGTSLFWYDEAGRLLLSQNAKQEGTHKYSYTLYDELSRISETGVVKLDEFASLDWEEIHAILILDIHNSKAFNHTDTVLSKKRTDVVKTIYDTSILNAPAYDFSQNNLRNRVSTLAYYHSLDATADLTQWDYAIHYSYDPTGNVKTLVNDFYQDSTMVNVTHRFKRIDYDYDVISGNVLQVNYQTGKEDAFYHRYTYDAENKITAVSTSRDGVIWDNDADYDYYPHGALARTALGEHQVQGVDYAYTIEGHLKMINSAHKEADMGRDGEAGSTFAADVFGISLNYYDGDYTSIASTNQELIASYIGTGASDLYNGNIASISLHNVDESYGRVYKYDQLNRIKSMQEKEIDDSLKVWLGNHPEANSTFYDYDKNGNLTDLQRIDGESGNTMDDLIYNYNSNNDQLTYVDDAVNDTLFGNDIDQQSSGNYAYDDIGNLTLDVAEDICDIKWYPNGKVKRIVRSTPTRQKSNLYFEYDPLGNRVKKSVSFVENDTFYIRNTYYVRDAQGNIMANYEERDCNFYNAQDSIGQFYYQYSETYAYYTQAAIDSLNQDMILFFLDSNFSQKNELYDEAVLALQDIPGFRDTVFKYLDLQDYFSIYPAAKTRVIQNDAHPYVRYLYDSSQTFFLGMANYRNEAYIEYLIEKDSIDEFYDSLFVNYYDLYGPDTRVSNYYSMLKALMDYYSSDETAMNGLTDLVEDDLSDLLSAIEDSEEALDSLEAWIMDLEAGLGEEDLSFFEAELRRIKAFMLIHNYDSSDMASVFQNINLNTFYAAMEGGTDQVDYELSLILHHARACGYTTIDLEVLLPYNPLVAIDWYDNYTDDELLDFLLLKTSADSLIINAHEAWFENVNMAQEDIYFIDSVTAKTYVINALLAHSDSSQFTQAILALDSLTRDNLYQTESIEQLADYFDQFFSEKVLLQNYWYDTLSTALGRLLHITPWSYAQELETALGLDFGALSSCTPYEIYMLADQFIVYGSDRLGVMNATSRQVSKHSFRRTLGAKHYELKDHLGNVMATVSDKKIHPQELLTLGTQNIDTTSGYQAEVGSRYDYYPFGMEIQSRSGDFTSINYSTNITEVLYSGLLNDCGDYSLIDFVNTSDTIRCHLDTNVYGQSYIDSLRIDHYDTPWGGRHRFEWEMDFSIPNQLGTLDTAADYSIQFFVTCHGRRIFGVTPEAGEESIAGDPDATLNDIRFSDDKILTFNYSGKQLDSLATNGIISFQIRATWGVSGKPWDDFAIVNEMRVSQTTENSSVPLSMRMDESYAYGFGGHERQDEVSGSGNWYDFGDYGYNSRIVQRPSRDPLSFKFPYQSPYTVFNGNPIFFVDPTGQAPEPGGGGEDDNDGGGKTKDQDEINQQARQEQGFSPVMPNPGNVDFSDDTDRRVFQQKSEMAYDNLETIKDGFEFASDGLSMFPGFALLSLGKKGFKAFRKYFLSNADEVVETTAKFTQKNADDLVVKLKNQYGGNVTVMKEGKPVFRVHQPNSHGNQNATLTRFNENVNPQTGRTYYNPETNVSTFDANAFDVLNQASNGEGGYTLVTRGGR